MDDYQDRVARLKEAIKSSDAILVGAGAGLSASAGLDYAGPAFRSRFADYIARYSFSDLYSAGFYPFATEAERWAYWARHIDFTRFSPPAFQAYLALAKILKDANYFVVTTNVDGQFFKAGFDPQRIMAFQGDYAEMQCARPCHQTVYNNEAVARDIIVHSQDLTVASEYLPRCPVCGGPMEMHLRKDGRFVEDENWHAAYARYMQFLEASISGRLLLLELGVGFNTPGIIRFPFEKLALYNPNVILARINRDDPEMPAELDERGLSFREDAARVITDLAATG